MVFGFFTVRADEPSEETKFPNASVRIQDEALDALENDQIERAFALATQAKQVYEEHLDNPNESDSYRQLLLLLAVCESSRGRYSESIEYVNQCIDNADTEKSLEPATNHFEIACQESALGNSLFEQGFHAKGLSLLVAAEIKLGAYAETGNIDRFQSLRTLSDLMMTSILIKSEADDCHECGRPFVGRALDLGYVVNVLSFARTNILANGASFVEHNDLLRGKQSDAEAVTRTFNEKRNKRIHLNITWGVYATTAELHFARAVEARDVGDVDKMADCYADARRCYETAKELADEYPTPKGTRLSQVFAASKIANVVLSALHDLQSTDPVAAAADLDLAECYLRTALKRSGHPRVLLNARLHQQLAQVALMRASALKTQVDVVAVDREFRAALALYRLHMSEFSEYATTLPFVTDLLKNHEEVFSDYLDFYFEHQSELMGKFPIATWFAGTGALIQEDPVVRARSQELVIDLRTYKMQAPNLTHRKVPALAALVATEDGCEIINLGPLSKIDFDNPLMAYSSLWQPISEVIGNRHLRRVSLGKAECMQSFRWDDYDLPAIRVGDKIVLTSFSDLGLNFAYPVSIRESLNIGRSQ